MPLLLQRCLDSILEREDTEVIVVDDNSDPEIVDFDNFPGHDRKDVICVFTKTQKGAGHAWNVGIEKASGKWVLLADADDFFSERLSDVLDYYITHNEYDVVQFPIKTVNSNTLLPQERDSWINETLFNDKLSDAHKLACVITGWSKIFKRSFLTENHIHCDEVPVANDVMFGARVAVHASRIKIDKTSIIYVLTCRNGSLVTQVSYKNVLLRVKIDIKRNNFYVKSGHKDWTRRIHCFYLFRHSYKDISNFQKIKILWTAAKSGYLSIKGAPGK